MDIEAMIQILMQQTSMTREEIKQAIDNEIQDFSGLIDEEWALTIIAKKKNISFRNYETPETDKRNYIALGDLPLTKGTYNIIAKYTGTMTRKPIPAKNLVITKYTLADQIEEHKTYDLVLFNAVPRFILPADAILRIDEGIFDLNAFEGKWEIKLSRNVGGISVAETINVPDSTGKTITKTIGKDWVRSA